VFRDPLGAKDYIRRKQGAPVVVKASGLAAGKGAIVCDREDEALEAVREMLEERRFGEAGAEIVIEERMSGEELSVFALTDGSSVLSLVPSQDHKPIGEGDVGPNTGGMGAYAPVSLAEPDLVEGIERDILLPTIGALERAGAPFRGLLYAGLMLTRDGPRVVEFNCRFGDPETQVVVPLLEGSLLEVLATVAEGGSLGGKRLGQGSGAAVTTVLASAGYPGRYEKGKPITIPHGLLEDPDLLIFHAGTRQEDRGLISSGGRVLAVTGLGATLGDASRRSLLGADAIDFDGKYFRTDIGWREFARDEGSRP
jgi:phosphoribosylamine--glycine ligase